MKRSLNNRIIHGEALDTLQYMKDNSVDSVVTDPPYGIKFMSKKWDYDIPDVELWEEVLRVLKPGGHILVACGTRTQHRMAVNLEDAGFEIRDVITWMHSQGFPKSQNIGKAVDKLQGNERKVLRKAKRTGKKTGTYGVFAGNNTVTSGESSYEGIGTGLKPACEFFTLCRKPLSENTVAKNVLCWGTGGINIDECRIKTSDNLVRKQGCNKNTSTPNAPNNGYITKAQNLNRFPANLVHDGSKEALDLFPKSGSGNNKKPYNYAGKEYDNKDTSIFNGDKPQAPSNFNDSGSAARFFYCAKASKAERNKAVRNVHATVKPIDLMSYLCRLITPPEGTVLDPFVGSGTTAIAAKKEGFKYIGVEQEQEYVEIARQRLKYFAKE